MIKKRFRFRKKKFGSDTYTDTHSFGRNSAPIPNLGRTLLQMMNRLEPLFKSGTGKQKGMPKGVDETQLCTTAPSGYAQKAMRN